MKKIKKKKNGKRQYSEEATKDGDLSNKDLWKALKLFLNNKGCQSTDFITIEKDSELINSSRPLSLGYSFRPKMY